MRMAFPRLELQSPSPSSPSVAKEKDSVICYLLSVICYLDVLHTHY
jgi:hypothetical protein